MRSEQQAAFYNEYVRRRQGDLGEDRIRKIVDSLRHPMHSVLDIGCGRGTLLRIIREAFSPERLVGVDVARDTAGLLHEQGIEGEAADASVGLPFADESFDTVICGEVIEHVVDTDKLVAEIHRVLRPGGTAVITTPNLAYVPNRIMLLFGLQPLFTETSLHRNLGRRWGVFGQGGSTQGHLKIFTLPALIELTQSGGLQVDGVRGYRFFQSGLLAQLDRLLAAKASLAAGFVLRARKAN